MCYKSVLEKVNPDILQVNIIYFVPFITLITTSHKYMPLSLILSESELQKYKYCIRVQPACLLGVLLYQYKNVNKFLLFNSSVAGEVLIFLSLSNIIFDLYMCKVCVLWVTSSVQ